MTIAEMKQEAKVSLKENWGLSIGAWLLQKLMIAGVLFLSLLLFRMPSFTFLIFLISFVFFLLPLSVGFSWMFLGFVDSERQRIRRLFDSFKNYWKVIGAILLKNLILAFWYFCFIFICVIFLVIAMALESVILLFLAIVILLFGFIAGATFLLIKSISYSQITCLLKDYPTIGALEAIKESTQLMSGSKEKYFLMNLSFLLWRLPSILLSIIGIVLISRTLVNSMIIFISHYPYRPTVPLQIFMLTWLGIVLISAAILYNFIINFYIIPYSSATRAVFYRSLVPLAKEKSEEVLERGSVLDVYN